MFNHICNSFFWISIPYKAWYKNVIFRFYWRGRIKSYRFSVSKFDEVNLVCNNKFSNERDKFTNG